MAKPLFSSDEERDQFYSSLIPTAAPAKPKGTTVGEDLTDLYSSAAKGLGSTIYGVGTFLAGNRSDIAQHGKRMQEYWQENKSEALKGEEAGSAALMSDKNASLYDVGAYVLSHPRLMANMLAESAPSMAVGMGAGGLIGRGMASVGIMAEGGILTTAGVRIAAGLGEGAAIMPEVYAETKGNKEAGIAALALGVGTTILTPGTLGEAAVKKMIGGVGDQTLNVLNKSAARRLGTAVLGEASQEFTQEGGQALLTQAGTLKADGSFGDLDWKSAGKQATVGAILGGVMGGGLHPLVGEGDPLKAKVVAQEAALTDRRKAAEADPNNPVLNAEVANAAANLDAVRIDQIAAVAPAEAQAEIAAQKAVSDLKVTATEARLAAERQPWDKDLQDAADTAQAVVALALSNGDTKTVERAATMAAASAVAAVQAAPDADSAIAAFAQGEQAGSTLRTAAKGIENTARAVDTAIAEMSHTYDPGTAEEFTPEQMREKALKEEIQTLRLRQQQAKTQQAEVKLQKEIAPVEPKKLETIEMTEAPFNPETSADVMIREQAKAVPGGSFMVEESMDTPGQYDVLTPDGEVYDSYANRQDADATAYRFNGLLDKEYARQQLPDQSIPRDRVALVGDIARREGYFGDMAGEDVRSAVSVLRNVTESTPPTEVLSALNTLDQRASGIVSPSTRTAWEQISTQIRSELPTQQTRLPEGAKVEEIDITAPGEAPTPGDRRRNIRSLANRIDGVLPQDYPHNVEVALTTLSQGHRGTATPRELLNAAREINSFVEDARHMNSIPRDQLRQYNQLHTEVVDQIRELGIEPESALTAARAPATDYAALLREAEAEVAAEESAVPRQPVARPRTEPGYRQVEQDFNRRAENARAEGTLDKLANFWRRVMRGAGTRTLPKVNLESVKADFRRAISAGRRPDQSLYNAIKEKYNAALKENARKWAEEHNQRFNEADWIDPIISMNYSGGSPIANRSVGFIADIYGLNRKAGKNPYMVSDDRHHAVISADYSIHAVRIQNARGAADLGYRLAAEIADLRGAPFPSDRTLLTVNNLRRQLQSNSADLLFGAGTINPMVTPSESGPQGVGVQVWASSTDDQRIGLNILRAAHSISENRGRGSTGETSGRFIENLMYDRQGRIVAFRDPRTPNGFERGTIVTDAMLEAKVGERHPTTNQAGYFSDEYGIGGVGASTAKLGILNNTLLYQIEGDEGAEIPNWLLTVARKEGRKQWGWFFSETEGVSDAGTTDEDAHLQMNELLGDSVSKLLLDSGIVSFVANEGDLTGDFMYDGNGRVQGATDPDGRITLLLDNIRNGDLGAVLQHEAIHSTLKALVGEKTYAQLMDRINKLIETGTGSTWLNDALVAVPQGTPAENRAEEVAGYAVEQYTKGAPESNPLVKWAKDFMSAIRTGILKSKLMPETAKLWAMKNLQPQDLSRLAVAGLKRAAKGNLINRMGGRGGQSVIRTADQYDADIQGLMTEHGAPATTRERRAELNVEIAKLRTARRVADEFEYERRQGFRLSVEEEAFVGTEPVAPEAPNEFNVMHRGKRSPIARTVERARQLIQDKHVTIDRIQRLAGITRDDIRMHTGGALDRLGSRIMSGQNELVLNPLARIENTLTNAGWKADEGREAIDELLKASHVSEYNDYIAEINPARYDANGNYLSGYDAEHPGSGITDEDAAATIDRLIGGEPDAKKEGLIEARKIYRQMIADLQNFAVAQGLEKQETVDRWNEKFPNYTPFNRKLNTEEESIGSVPGNRGFSLRAGISRRAMGSGAEIVSPLVSTTLFGLKTVVRGENATVGRTMLDFARNFTPKFRTGSREWKPMFKVNSTQTQRVIKHVNVYTVRKADGSISSEFYNREQARAYADGQQAIWAAANPNADPNTSGIAVERIGDTPLPRVVVQPVPNQLNQPNVMVIPENGENMVIEFDAQSEDAMNVLNAFKGPVGKGSNVLMNMARTFSRWVQATATGYNPVFSIFNAARDVQAAMVTIGSDKIPGWTVADSLSIAREFMPAAANIWRQEGLAFRALHSNEQIDTTPEPGSYAEWAQEAERYGGVTGVRESIFDREGAETQLRRLFGQEELNKHRSINDPNDRLSRAHEITVKIGDAFARFGQGETKAPIAGWISRNLVAATARLNESSELATRTLVFKKATEKFMADGKSEQEAKTLAAAIAKNVSANFNRRGDISSTMNQLWPFFNAAVQGTARIAETLFEKETYKVTDNGDVITDEKTKLSGYGKKVIGSLVALGGLQSALLALAGFKDDEPPEHVRERNFIIPVGSGSYLTIPMPHGLNILINFGREMTDAVINPNKAIEHIAQGLWQLPALNPFGGAGNHLSDFAPALADPFINIYVNRDAFGRPIAKEDRDPANPTPGFTRAKEGASGFGRMLAEAINRVTGGNDDRQGYVSPTPDQIDFVTGQITGGVGREVAKAAGLVSTLAAKAAGQETEAIPSYKLPLVGRLYGNTQEPAAIRSRAFDIRKDLNKTYAEWKGMRDRREIAEAREFWKEHPELRLRDDFERFAKQDSKQRKARALARSKDDIGKVNKITASQDDRVRDLVSKYETLMNP